MVKILTWNKPRDPSDSEIGSLLNDGLNPFHFVLEQGENTGVCQLPYKEVRIVSDGKIELCIEGRRHFLKKGDKVEIPVGFPFLMRNVGLSQAVLLCAKKAKTVFIEIY